MTPIDPHPINHGGCHGGCHHKWNTTVTDRHGNQRVACSRCGLSLMMHQYLEDEHEPKDIE